MHMYMYMYSYSVTFRTLLSSLPNFDISFYFFRQLYNSTDDTSYILRHTLIHFIVVKVKPKIVSP